MKNGTHTIYCVQYRRKAEGPWLKLDAAIKATPVAKRDDWNFCSPDAWGKSMIPYRGKGNKRRPVNPVATRQYCTLHDVTGFHGWLNMAYASAAFQRANRDSDAGVYDSRDGYGQLHQRVRFEFRVVKVVVMYGLLVSEVES